MSTFEEAENALKQGKRVTVMMWGTTKYEMGIGCIVNCFNPHIVRSISTSMRKRNDWVIE